jgi:hypothetical protein
MGVTSKIYNAHRWPSEPALFYDSPTLKHGQSCEDWSTSHENWVESLSPADFNEVTAYRRDVNRYLRLRAWRKRRELVVGWTVGIVSAILLGAFLDLFDSTTARVLGNLLQVDTNIAFETKFPNDSMLELR